MALSTAPAVLLLTGIDLLAKNINTESDASHRVIKQLTTAFAKLHGDTRLIIVCVASHPDKLPPELGRWLEQRLVLAPLDRIKRATLIKQIWSTEIETISQQWHKWHRCYPVIMNKRFGVFVDMLLFYIV
ncbi:hypothetical protein BDF19DRAFT_134322 [Syncephalis fuscata]|nr:hypothetical protein BDF19DRAFT_134322 [Syncephalis fuscata]